MLKKKKKLGARRRAKKVEQEQEQEEKDEEDMDVDGEDEVSHNLCGLELTPRTTRSRRRRRSRHLPPQLQHPWLWTRTMMTTTRRSSSR